jgi:glycosyltransferase involved in cell wall biosynthesis
MSTPSILILGKLPPPYMGPSVATEILLNSSLRNHFRLLHVDTKAYRSLNELGKWSIRKVFKNISIYFQLLFTCLLKRPSLVLIPISQATVGFLKDSVFILISRITFRKIVLQLRGSDFKRWYDSRNNLLKIYIRFVLKRTDGVIVLGHNLRYIFRDFFSDDKIFVSPNGGNYQIRKTSHDPGILKILYLANLNETKGIEDVLQAIRLLQEKGTKGFNLDVAGSWRSELFRKHCLELVDKYALPVSFYPPASGNEKLKLLGEADVFVFTPREPEGHPWVIVEAMAAGLPVIATDQGAIVESVIHRENGFIVPVNSPSSIASGLEDLLNHGELRKKMSESSLRFYNEKFTEEKMVARLEHAFNSIIRKNSSK